jgi:hypothetical protein
MFLGENSPEYLRDVGSFTNGNSYQRSSCLTVYG